MTKRILIFTTITLLLFIIGYYINSSLLASNEVIVRFSVLQVYAFNAIACAVVYALIEIVSNYLPNETGYLYLGLLMVKLGVFILIFQDALFSEVGLSKAEKASILLPVLVFLGLETIGVSKLLNNK